MQFYHSVIIRFKEYDNGVLKKMSNRPFGRKKYVSGESDEVNRRGDGLDLGGPLGQDNSHSDSSGDNSSSKKQSGGPLRTAGKSSPILLIIVAVVFMFLNKNGGTPSDIPTFGNSNNNNSNAIINVGELDRSVSDKARPKQGVSNNADSATIMIYMCGSDLESRAGAATADLQEMMKAQIADNVNILIETGGSPEWKNNIVSGETNQIYKLTTNGMELVKDDLGSRSMVEPETLSDFIRFCKSSYPADRYQLIFWDHGGGSIGGFGYDMNHPGSSMTLDKIDTALKNGGCYFDYIGFDACLMATLETAITMEKYADYLIASEETEPGGGWYYTNWITKLSQNTSIDTLDLGKAIIDDFINYTPQGSTTLSLIDLAELDGTIPETFKSFSNSTATLIKSDNFKLVSDARNEVREFGRASATDSIDIIQFAEKINTPESKAFSKALQGCVKYNLTDDGMKDCGGISVYFPSQDLNKVDTALKTFTRLNLDEKYSECIKNYSNLEVGGQIASGQGTLLDTLFGSLLANAGGSSSTSNSKPDVGSLIQSALSGGMGNIFGGKAVPTWVDKNLILDSSDYLKENSFDSTQLIFTKKSGHEIIKLSQSQWDLVQDLELNVFVDDGKGYIDLGLDNTFSFDDDGDLEADYDKTWLAINGQVVSYYFLSKEGTEENYVIKGRVPAMLNGGLVDLILEFTDENPKGTVLGARINYNGVTENEAKGLLTIKAGDKIDFLCDYYTYGKQLQNNYYLGEQLIVNGPLAISNVNIGSKKYIAAYRFTDIYQNKYWTPSIKGQ